MVDDEIHSPDRSRQLHSNEGIISVITGPELFCLGTCPSHALRASDMVIKDATEPLGAPTKIVVSLDGASVAETVSGLGSSFNGFCCVTPEVREISPRSDEAADDFSPNNRFHSGTIPQAVSKSYLCRLRSPELVSDLLNITLCVPKIRTAAVGTRRKRHGYQTAIVFIYELTCSLNSVGEDKLLVYFEPERDSGPAERMLRLVADTSHALTYINERSPYNVKRPIRINRRTKALAANFAFGHLEVFLNLKSLTTTKTMAGINWTLLTIICSSPSMITHASIISATRYGTAPLGKKLRRWDATISRKKVPYS